MNFILLAYDASPRAEEAFDFALTIANKTQAEITVVAGPLLSEEKNFSISESNLNTNPDEEFATTVALIMNSYNIKFDNLKRKSYAYSSILIHFEITDGSPIQIINDWIKNLKSNHRIESPEEFKNWLWVCSSKRVNKGEM